MSVAIHDTRLYEIYLQVQGTTYACADVELDYTINEVPYAKVTIGCGVSLKNPKEDESGMQPEELLALVLSKRTVGYSSMVPCTIAYRIPDKDKGYAVITLLDGYIASGAVHYKTEPTTSRTISFMCLHKACALMIRPVVEYLYTCNAAAAAVIANKGDINSKNANQLQPVAGKEDRNAHIKDIQATIKNDTPISDIIGTIIDKIIEVNSYIHGGKGSGPKTKVTDYLSSDYCLNLAALTDAGQNALNDTTRSSYVAALFDDILELFSSNDVWNTIRSSIDMESRCLNIIPGGPAKDFKLMIEPSRAWEDDSSIEIYAGAISSIQTTFSPITCLTTPDIFTVIFDNAVVVAPHMSSMFKLTGERGVFALNKKVEEYIRHKSTADNSIDANAYNRIKAVVAPKWLTHCFWQDKMIAIKEEGADKKPTIAKKKYTTAKDTSVASNVVFSKDKKAVKSADAIAKALFAHMYGTGETASITMTLKVMELEKENNKYVHALHDSIGSLVDVYMSPDNDTKDNPLNIRGRLRNISISYSAGLSTLFNYSIELDCVRPIPKKEEDRLNITCPFYKKIHTEEKKTKFGIAQAYVNNATSGTVNY